MNNSTIQTMRRHALRLLAITLIHWPTLAPAEEFPYRSRYPDAPIIESAELAKRLDEVILVDVRSDYEYATLRIDKAINIPLTDRNFVPRLKELRANSNRTIVFYCNGTTCHKSYDAALLAKNSRVDNVLVYDAGVLTWAREYPGNTALLGKSPIDPRDLIDEGYFKSRLLTPQAFTEKVSDRTVVLDVRDKMQRDNPLFPLKEVRAQLDERDKVRAIIESAKKERKTLLVYDAAGKQVQWFQYEIEANGMKDYYFMKGGAQAYWDYRLGAGAATK